jgi:hypothetical protein
VLIFHRFLLHHGVCRVEVHGILPFMVAAGSTLPDLNTLDQETLKELFLSHNPDDSRTDS